MCYRSSEDFKWWRVRDSSQRLPFSLSIWQTHLRRPPHSEASHATIRDKFRARSGRPFEARNVRGADPPPSASSLVESRIEKGSHFGATKSEHCGTQTPP